MGRRRIKNAHEHTRHSFFNNGRQQRSEQPPRPATSTSPLCPASNRSHREPCDQAPCQARAGLPLSPSMGPWGGRSNVQRTNRALSAPLPQRLTRLLAHTHRQSINRCIPGWPSSGGCCGPGDSSSPWRRPRRRSTRACGRLPAPSTPSRVRNVVVDLERRVVTWIGQSIHPMTQQHRSDTLLLWGVGQDD